VRGFEFEKALMQEHFNENYMESEKFPGSEFKGKITNIKDVNLTKKGVYKVVVEGDLTIHGVTNKVKVNGTLETNAGKVIGKASINVAPIDYNIAIPKAVIKNISEAIKVDVNVSLDKFGN
jgi:polyisoprenoid-binding protein YceI